MGGWHVRRNEFPKIIRALPKAIDDQVDEDGNDLSQDIAEVIWKDTGLLSRITASHPAGSNHCEISVGYYLGHGFYSGFQEFGTRKQAARPIVGPLANAYGATIFPKNMGNAVRQACDV